MTIFQGLVLGIVQGIAEWLPVSSEAMVSLVALYVLQIDPTTVLPIALLLHIGTLIAAAWYFRQQIAQLVTNPARQKQQWQFYTVATLVSLGLGGMLYLGLSEIVLEPKAGSWLTIIMGTALLVTAYLLTKKQSGLRDLPQSNLLDSVIMGLVQGAAVIPGISRSGSTVAVLLWRDFSAKESIQTSFIMGIPMIAIGAILLVLTNSNLTGFFSWGGLVALAVSAVVGYVTIEWLMRLARRVNFAKFVFIFGLISLVSGSISLL